MTGPLDLVTRLEGWLAEEDDARLPERVVEAAIVAASRVPQARRPGLRGPIGLRWAAALTAVLVVAVMAVALYRSSLPSPGTESPSPSASSAASASPDASVPGLRPLVHRDCGQQPTADGDPPPALGVVEACGHVLDLTGWEGPPSPEDLGSRQFRAQIYCSGWPRGARTVIGTSGTGFEASMPGDGNLCTPTPVALYLTWYDPIPPDELPERARAMADARTDGEAYGGFVTDAGDPYWRITSHRMALGPQPLTTLRVTQYLILTDNGLLLGTFATTSTDPAFDAEFRAIVAGLRPVTEARTWTSDALGFAVEKPDEAGPWAGFLYAPIDAGMVVTFPDGDFLGGDVYSDFILVSVGTEALGAVVDVAFPETPSPGPSASPANPDWAHATPVLVWAPTSEQLADAYVAAVGGTIAGVTMLGGEPAVVISNASSMTRVVVAVHAGRVYVVSTTGFLRASVAPGWDAFLSSFEFLD